MAERKQGTIINIASDLGINPVKGMGAYGTAKGGVILLTKHLALELAEYNIRVNAIAPGLVRTDMNVQLRSTPEIEKKLASGMMLGRLGETSDISNAVVFLASDNSSWVTGQTIAVNGGGQIVPPVV
jgi:NAD(P)-dependent dehydrogenase (short-subunit alcohol dehydrogenase family)